MLSNWSLVLEIAQNVCIIGLAAFLTTRVPAIKNAFTYSRYRLRDKIMLLFIFGAFSAVGNWMGIPILESMANTRIVGPIAGGLLGGPLVGVGAGILGAIPRYFMGGFTMWASVSANMIAGCISGWVYYRFGPQRISLPIAAVTAFASEAILKILVLAISEPFAAAWELEKIIAVPTMISNTLAVVFFVYIVHDIFQEQEKAQALSVQQAIRMLQTTSGFMQSGLNEETAGKVAQIIYNETKAAAVAVTNLEKILAFNGIGADHHQVGAPILTAATKTMMKTKHTVIFNNSKDIGCPHPECKLTAVIEIPLIVSNELLGSIKLYKANKEIISLQEVELIQGIADFLSLQLAQRKLDEQQLVLLQIECQMLKAQINPHFFFNTLGTIQALIDTSPKDAKVLVKDLAEFYRRTLKRSADAVTLQEELQSVRNYVRIEKVRFGEKINIVESVPDALLCHQVPLFSLQLLVENAIRHGISLKKESGTIQISAWQDGSFFYVQVDDDGVGIAAENLSRILDDFPEKKGDGLGIGLVNIHRRIQRFYGESCGLQVKSSQGKGTRVTMRLPLNVMEEQTSCEN